MTDDRDIHFAADEEMLERFVLGKFPDAERTSAQKHLASCASCAAAVRNERLIAAGTRRLGRDHLKSSLSERVREPNASARPWLKILSAAAVVLIIVGVGLYNDWFREKHEVLDVHSDKPVRSYALEDESAVKSDASAPTRPTDAPHQKRNAGTGDSPRESDRLALTEQAAKDSEGEARSDRATGTGARSEIAAASPAQVHLEQTTGTLWTEGVPLGQEEKSRPSGAMKKTAQESSSDKELQRAKPARVDANETDKGSVGEVKDNYRISQRPVSALPHEQMLKQQHQLQNTVQTKIEQRQGFTEMTLYLDSLLDTRDLQQANVETVSEDSLVVNMGNQRIGYRLPTGFNTQRQRRAK